MKKSSPPRSLRDRASGTDAMIALLTLVLIAGAALYGVVTSVTLYGKVPDPVSASSPPTQFSSERALEHVRIIAQEPHPMGSPENAAVRDYLVKELEAMGLEPEVHQTTAAHYVFVEGFAEAGTPENVLVRLEGTADGDKAFVLMAHYDSVSTAPGAGDDGAGVATMLETLRALKAGVPLKNDVIFLFTDGEERGLLGARAFVEDHPWAEDVGVVLNLEGRGNTGPAIMYRTNDENGWLIREFAKTVPYPFATSDTAAFYAFSGGGSDLRVFLDAGLTGIDIAHTEGHAYYHTPLDNPQELDERSLQHMGSYAVALTHHFGNVGLDQTKGPDRVYFNVLGSMIHYPERWAIPLVAFVSLFFFAVATFGFRRGRLTFGGIGLGFLALLGSMVLAALGMYLIWALIHALHPGGVWALQYKALLVWTGFVGLTVAITAALYAVLRQKVRVADLAVGALIWWLFLAVATAISLPATSYLFLWPLFFSLVGLGVFFALGDRATSPWFPFAALTLGAIPAVFLFVPAVYGVTATQGLLLSSAVPVFALSIVLMMGLLIPHIDLVAKPNRWVLTGGAAVLGLGLLLAGSLTAGFDARHPRPNSILYALNADTKQAIWQSGDEEPDAWTAQFLRTDAEKGSVAEYLGEAGELHSDAPTVALAAPKVALLDDGTRNGVRTLRMRVTAPPKANVVVVEAGAGAQVVGAAVNGERLPEVTGGMAEWNLNYWDPPSEGVEFTLDVESTGPLSITARAGTPGLPDIPGKTYRDRPPDMMPIAWNSPLVEQDSSTVVSKSFTFAARPGNEETK